MQPGTHHVLAAAIAACLLIAPVSASGQWTYDQEPPSPGMAAAPARRAKPEKKSSAPQKVGRQRKPAQKASYRNPDPIARDPNGNVLTQQECKSGAHMLCYWDAQDGRPHLDKTNVGWAATYNPKKPVYHWKASGSVDLCYQMRPSGVSSQKPFIVQCP